MSPPLRICLWSSGFQADSQALAHHLGLQSDVALTIAMPEPARYAAEPVNRILPIHARIVDREEKGLAGKLRREGFDLFIIDNHLPDEAIAPRLFVLWHGFGWRIDDLSAMRKELGSLVGDVTRPNPRFRWQAFGPWDRDYRINHSRLAPENVVALGSAYSDLLLPAGEQAIGTAEHQVESEIPRALLPVPDPGQPQILLGLTWHHGAALAQWGDDPPLLARLFDHATARGTRVLARMHDRHRYEPTYLAALERAATGRANVRLAFKSEHPDSLVDLLSSSVLVSNYSSLLNAFYYTRRPTVHLDPHLPGGKGLVYRRWKRGKLREERVNSPAEIWKLDPGEIGGLRAQSFDEALDAIDRALDEPHCCEGKARRFTDRYITGADGHTCDRITGYLRSWLAEPV
jgi:hypothetical protein